MRNADEHKGQPVEEPWQRETDDRLEIPEDEPPDDRGDQVHRGDAVQLLGGLADFARQQGDLVGVGSDDLAQAQEEGVYRPVADNANLHPFLEARRGDVVLPKEELVAGLLVRLIVVDVFVARAVGRVVMEKGAGRPGGSPVVLGDRSSRRMAAP